jgi:glycosyltransferase involved in cell wall biosynthesis
MSAAAPTARVGFLLQQLEDGGVERCFANLARGFVERGIGADLVVRELPEHLAAMVAPGVNLIRPEGPTDRLEPLIEALSAGARPAALIAAKETDARLAKRLAARLGVPTVLVASLDYTGQLDGRGAGRWRRWLRYRTIRRQYAAADRVFCVSRGVAEDMARILGHASPPMRVLPNPVVTPELHELAAGPLNHPWFAPGQPPVILGVGRLSLIKNFPMLVRAFARIQQKTGARLVILGEGKQRASLLRLGERLGVARHMELPGHMPNPYPYMARAGLFVLSSLWEGFGNVLVEALACGTPVVATDCRSGPAEILDGGRYGPLVPVGRETALAEAMIGTLQAPLASEILKRAAAPYTLDNSVEAYLDALGLVTGNG